MDEKPKIKSPYEPMKNHKDDTDDAKKPFESQYPHWDRILRDTDSLPVNSCKFRQIQVYT